MKTSDLLSWARRHGVVEYHQDKVLSLSSHLLRFKWEGDHAIGVGSEHPAKTRINAVLDGVAWWMADSPATGTLRMVFGVDADQLSEGKPFFEQSPAFREQFGAIATLIAEIQTAPAVQLWLVDAHGIPRQVSPQRPRFDGLPNWSEHLMQTAQQPVPHLAQALVKAVAHPAFALYPKLSANPSEPWQMRLDGLEIGRVGASTGRLQLATGDVSKPGEPRVTWRKVVVDPDPVSFDHASLAGAVALIHSLISAWQGGQAPTAVLRHGQAEHALEGHVLSGRLTLHTSTGPLRLAAPCGDGALRAAQFPTLWGEVARPVRYLDALLADPAGRPWAVELKDHATGNHGAYLRHGIAQAVLYRHYIRSVQELDGWFTHWGLDRSQCQAAVAFPSAAPASAKTVDEHRKLARQFGVEVIEFARP